MPTTPAATVREAAADTTARNEVHLVGRVSAPPEQRVMPSGDELAVFRLVVDRPAAARHGPRSPTIDTVDVVCWSAATRRKASRWAGGELVAVDGALLRRFWKPPAGARVSRYEVEAFALKVLRRP
ncbi:single-stranded DNA-binding protein [Flexivirga sp. ID2601S]|uniref:Single-stranded DNA-binding protein n=1 Tax=Flexivirga aerilata TaxID=1656889 RepID=A0A849ASR5_9MICO|nr:single-stranded DNA-binding protein [Flexivirga aerilata]NNG41310.1 single-stranded DNA-binding protein [Flexivirga aerilata]